ncbi:MAG: YihY/virulence factor BrkB family protein [Bacteroidales bacterium]
MRTSGRPEKKRKRPESEETLNQGQDVQSGNHGRTGQAKPPVQSGIHGQSGPSLQQKVPKQFRQQIFTDGDKEKFSFRHLPSLIKEAVLSWNRDDPWRLSAVVAYYAILSLPGLLVVIISVVGYFWGADMVEGELYDQMENAMGAKTAEGVLSIFESAREGDQTLISTLISIGGLLFGATGVFYHLQVSLNKVWGIQPDPKSAIIRYLLDRVRSFGFVLAIAFLLLMSFVISALLSAVQEYLGTWFPEISLYFVQLMNLIIPLAVITALFALIFKYLPDAYIKWKTVWIGAFITSFLFTIGKELLSFYFSETSPGNMYGAAGSIIIVLLWVTYSCLILLFGAEFSWVYSERYGYGIRPKSYAKYVYTTMEPGDK